MIGTTELLMILGIILVIAIFGRKTFKKILKDLFGAKNDYEEIKNEFNKPSEKKSDIVSD
jgi:Sec-independent protein translocase protein TatA